MKKIMRYLLRLLRRRGLIIVIDGKDGSGKATQVGLLVEVLRSLGHKVKTLDFPQYDSNFVGGFIAEALGKKPGTVMPVDKDAFLASDPRLVSMVYAIDRHESSKKIREWVESGYIVVLDRFVSSNQIHQGGKISDPQIRKRFLEWLDILEHKVLGVPRPELIVYLDVPVEVSMKLARDRAAQKGESPDVAEVNEAHQRASGESALSIIESMNNWVRIQCADEQGNMLPRETIRDRILAVIRPLL